jgi:hypothetical protein
VRGVWGGVSRAAWQELGLGQGEHNNDDGA